MQLDPDAGINGASVGLPIGVRGGRSVADDRALRLRRARVRSGMAVRPSGALSVARAGVILVTVEKDQAAPLDERHGKGMLHAADLRNSMRSPIRRKTEPARDVIHRLAHEMHRPVEEVKTIYERQLETLEARASVLSFVEILAQRKTREVLRRS